MVHTAHLVSGLASSIDLCIDIMFVNEMPFLTSITKALFYRMALFLPTQTARDLYAALDNIFHLYNSNGFSIAKIFSDNQFQTIMDPVQDDLDVTMVYSAAQAHEPVSERNNRVIKERVRAAFHRLPYKALPKAIMKALVIESARKLNYFPAKHGISKHYSPRQIVHQTTLNYEHECKYAIGTYVQAHDEPNPTNTQAPRSLDAIYIRATDTGHDVYDLSTQKIINRRRLTAMPITPTVIKAVEDIADAEKQKGLRIKTKKGRTLYDSSWTAGVDYDEEDDDEDSDYEYDSDDSQCRLQEGTTTKKKTTKTLTMSTIPMTPNVVLRTRKLTQTRTQTMTNIPSTLKKSKASCTNLRLQECAKEIQSKNSPNRNKRTNDLKSQQNQQDDPQG